MNVQGIRVASLKIDQAKVAEWRKAIRAPASKIQAGVAPTDEDFVGSDKVLKEVGEMVKADLAKVGYSADRGDNVGLHFPTLETEAVVVFVIPGGIFSMAEIEAMRKAEGAGNVIDLHGDRK